MENLWWMILVIIVVALVITIAVVRKRKVRARNAREQKPQPNADEFISAVNRATEDERSRMQLAPKSISNAPGVKEANQLITDARDARILREREAELSRVRAEFEAALTLTDAFERYKALEDVEFWRLPTDEEQKRGSKAQNDAQKQALEEAVNGSLDNQDRKLYKRAVKLAQNWPLYNRGSHEKKYPARWNEMIAYFMKEPELDDFVGMKDDLKGGMARRMAVQALRSKSLVEIKIVLAYAKESEYTGGYHNRSLTFSYRDEIGEIMLNELTTLAIDLEYHKPALEPAVAQTTPSVSTPE